MQANLIYRKMIRAHIAFRRFLAPRIHHGGLELIRAFFHVKITKLRKGRSILGASAPCDALSEFQNRIAKNVPLICYRRVMTLGVWY